MIRSCGDRAVQHLLGLMVTDRGHSIEEISARPYEVSAKSQSLKRAPNGERDPERYARLTAENATAAAERGKRSRA
jgi:hypothetical protein